MAKTLVAGVSHQHHALLAALFRDGRNTRVATQSAIISFGKSGARFRDYSSRHDSDSLSAPDLLSATLNDGILLADKA
jgi:hypothetical protein